MHTLCLARIVVVAGFSFIATAVVAAPADDVLALIKSASEAFAQQNWDEAQARLSAAQRQADAAGLGRDKLMARILVHQGAVLAAGADKPGEAVLTFRRALKIFPGAKLTSTLARPEVLEAFKKAVIMERAELAGEAAPAPAEPAAESVAVAAAAAPEPAAAAAPEPAAAPAPIPTPTPPEKPERTGPEEPDMPADIPRPLYCPNPDEAPPRRKAVLRCVVQPELDVGRVILYYRLPNAEDYEKVPATKTPRGWYVAIVPAKAFSGRLFQYYFEARDPTDAALADNGRYDSPNLMFIREGAPPVTHSALAVRMDDGSAIQTEDEEEDDPLSRLTSNKLSEEENRFWVALSLGRGVGFHGTAQLEWYGEEISGGTKSASLLHISPELGYRVSKHFALALQLRSQIITHTGSEPGMGGGPAVGANAGLVRLIWYVPVGANSSLQISTLGGAGEGFRLLVPPNEVLMRNSSDTIRGGAFLVGAGFHYDQGISEGWALRLGIEVLQGLPTAATVIDFALGGVLRF